jgi:hypothetical protein
LKEFCKRFDSIQKTEKEKRKKKKKKSEKAEGNLSGPAPVSASAHLGSNCERVFFLPPQPLTPRTHLSAPSSSPELPPSLSLYSETVTGFTPPLLSPELNAIKNRP